MFGWDESEEIPEATWLDLSEYYRENYKCVTFSEYDREEKPVCYSKEHSQACTDIKLLPLITNLAFNPITFLTCYYFQTHKGRCTVQPTWIYLFVTIAINVKLSQKDVIRNN